jgi:hypothetical protein
MKYGPEDVEMWRPVGDPIPVEIVPFGDSGHEVQLSRSIHITEDNFTEYENKLAWALRGLGGGWYVGEPWSLGVNYDF